MVRIVLGLVLGIVLGAQPAFAGKVRLTITSDPVGASVEWNGQYLGATPHAEEMEDWAFKAPRWLWSKYLGEEIRVRVWKDGYFPKDVTLTSGPFLWTNMNQTATKMYYVINSPNVHVRLEPMRAPEPTAPARPVAAAPTESGPTVVSGSGFLISRTGYVVTNFHVVEDADRISVRFPNSEYTRAATIALKDQVNDLAILQLRDFDPGYLGTDPIPFSLAPQGAVKMGQSAYTIGFPLGDVMGSSPRLSSGLISALFGLRDDPRVLQISNPVQPGNSGGPLLNESGELVGIVVSGLSAKYFYENAGIIPQNMNFAVKGAYLRSLIEMLPSGHDLLKPALSPLKGLPLDRQVEKVTPFVANVIAYGPESGSPSRVSEPPTPVSSHEDPIVLMIPRGAIYHKSKDCISLTGHDQIQFRLSQVATWAKPCPQCKPLTR